MIKYGVELREWKAADTVTEELIANAQGPKETALAHYQSASLFFREGLDKHKDEFFSRAHDEAGKALAAYPNFPDALSLDGRCLARLRQDDAAKTQFEQYLKLHTTDDPDGQQISTIDLQGKVVPLDLWATWCAPCREALPHMRNVAKKFQGQPLVILNVSLDSDQAKWKEFIEKNEMTWLQYRDGGFTGPISELFGVKAIPHTFTIDSYGVLQEEHIGDASIEGKLKKRLSQIPATPPQSPAK